MKRKPLLSSSSVGKTAKSSKKSTKNGVFDSEMSKVQRKYDSLKEKNEKYFSNTSENNEHKDDIDKNILDDKDDMGIDELEENESQDDPFMKQLSYELSPSLLHSMTLKPRPVNSVKKSLTFLGNIIFSSPKIDYCLKSKNTLIDKEDYAELRGLPSIREHFRLEDLFIKQQIIENIKMANNKFINSDFTGLQKDLYHLICNYQDVYFPGRDFNNGEEVRFVYCTHAINHVLKARLKVSHHNARLQHKIEIPEEFRDQGLVRPKVLILLPLRNSALRVVKMLISILLGDGGNVMNKKRFMDEFGSPEISMPKSKPKPHDYVLQFDGNIDDNFRIGISVTKKCFKLYSDFYASDIIIASPLGLRLLIGAKGEKDRDYDFLSSIELLIIDQAEVMLMQNWEHVLHLMDHLHLQPRESHGSDLVRVRMWALNGLSKYYRQTLVFSSSALPEITALFSNKCSNFSGKIVITNPVQVGSICKVILQVPQVFHYVNATSVSNAVDERFDYFVKTVLQDYKDTTMKHTLIYVPSYFDYVRIRNYFKKQDISFVQICEYSKDNKIARARGKFFNAEAHFLLYSERFHFFRRIRVRGIHNIIFYQLPAFSHFYSEMCNMMQDMKNNARNEGQREMNVTVLYSKYDAIQLASIVGLERATRMLASDKQVHMFMADS